MERHYNAFISYRHHPDDIRVATDIHRSLEHFRIPKALRKQNEGPFRLFRDKEELPASSNLSDDIAAALKNSDYLVVICSVHTKESVWVQREIEMFLQTHDRGKVLTVLAGGEPYEVIPEILLHDEKVDPVTGDVTVVDREPLSCDWRLPRRKAKNEELPRLAAALLGCPYDELRQRQRQYRMKRLVAVFSAALVASLCLTAYFVYTTLTIRDANIRIQENLNTALKNQSMHLATAAEERLAQGDRLTAIALAMAALPSDGNERPYVPEAEAALTDTLGVYGVNEDVAAVGVLDLDANVAVRDFWLTASGKVLYMFDKRQIMTAWDTASMTQLGTIRTETVVTSALTTAQDTIVFFDGDTDILYCCSPQGERLWEAANCRDMAMLSDGNTVAAITLNDELVFFNTVDGAMTREPIAVAPVKDGFQFSTFPADEYPVDMPVTLMCSDATDEYILFSVDPATGKQTVMAEKTAFPSHAYQTADGKLLVMVNDGTGMQAGFMGDSRLTETGRYEIVCLDVKNGATLWKTDMPFYTYTGFHLMKQIPQSNRVLCAAGNVLQVHDLQSGERVAHCQAGSGILDIEIGEQLAVAMLQDGYRCVYMYENMCYEKQITDSALRQACVFGGDFFTLGQLESHVTAYRTVTGEALWTVPVDGSYISVQTAHGDLLAGGSYKGVYLFDLKQQKMLWQVEQACHQLRFTDDGTKLWSISNYDNALTVFDTATGEAVTTKLPDDPQAEGYESMAGSAFMMQERVYYLKKSDGSLKLLCWSPNDDTVTVVARIDKEMLEQEDYWKAEIAAAHDSTFWVWLDSGTLLEADTVTGAVRLVAQGATSKPAFAFLPSGETAMAIGKEILVSRDGREPHRRIETQAVAGALYCLGDELLALCDDGAVHRFDKTGTLLSRTMLDVYDTFVNNLLGGGPVGWYVTSDNKLVVNACGYGNIIDLDSWNCHASMSDFVMYYTDGKALICTAADGLKAFPIYTVDELLAVGKEQLGDFELSDEQRAAYGID